MNIGFYPEIRQTSKYRQKLKKWFQIFFFRCCNIRCGPVQTCGVQTNFGSKSFRRYSFRRRRQQGERGRPLDQRLSPVAGGHLGHRRNLSLWHFRCFSHSNYAKSILSTFNPVSRCTGHRQHARRRPPASHTSRLGPGICR